ncbi:hypothetical protein LCGC14_2954560, partial [marine sediment metagenome]
VNEFEWRGQGGLTLTATPKAALAIGDWIVFGLLFEVFHMVCNVASADCTAAPFGTNTAQAIKLTDLGSLTTATGDMGGNGTTLVDMTFYSASTTIGWACAFLCYVRTGVVLDEITVPASCLSFLGQTCSFNFVGTCLEFDPTLCIECYPLDQQLPLRVKFGPNPVLTITPTPDAPYQWNPGGPVVPHLAAWVPRTDRRYGTRDRAVRVNARSPDYADGQRPRRESSTDAAARPAARPTDAAGKRRWM